MAELSCGKSCYFVKQTKQRNVKSCGSNMRSLIRYLQDKHTSIIKQTSSEESKEGPKGRIE